MKSDGVIIGALAVAFVAAVLGFWAIRSSFEAKAFNNATGKNVSTWDAMWIELRVQQEAK